MTAKIADQERKLANMTKLMDINSTIQNKSDQKINFDLSKIDLIIEKRIKEASKSYIDRKTFENRLHEIELKLKSPSNQYDANIDN